MPAPFLLNNTDLRSLGPDPVFYGTIAPATTGTALGPALRFQGITTSEMFGITQNLTQGLYFSVAGSAPFRIYGNSGECAANGNRCFTVIGNQYHFMPIKGGTALENLWIVASVAGTTLSIRGH